MTKTLSLFEFCFWRKQNSPLGLLQELHHHFSARSAGARRASEGIPPPHPLLPSLARRATFSARNGFALFLEYPTLQNFSTFSLGTSPNARRAQRRGSQGIEPKNPTAQKTKRKRIEYLKS